MEPENVPAQGKYPRTVKPYSVPCGWGVREMGMTTVRLGKQLDLARPTIGQAVARGQKIASQMKLRLIEQQPFMQWASFDFPWGGEGVCGLFLW